MVTTSLNKKYICNLLTCYGIVYRCSSYTSSCSEGHPPEVSSRRIMPQANLAKPWQVPSQSPSKGGRKKMTSCHVLKAKTSRREKKKTNWGKKQVYIKEFPLFRFMEWAFQVCEKLTIFPVEMDSGSDGTLKSKEFFWAKWIRSTNRSSGFF